MSSSIPDDAKVVNINDSWVELTMSAPLLDSSVSLTPGTIERLLMEAQHHTSDRTELPISKPISHSNMEKLLLEAQKEWSRNSSRIGSTVASGTSSRTSPICPRSPCNELASLTLINPANTIRETMDQTLQTDWIWDWSSRPEIIPSSEYSGSSRYQVPVKRSTLSIRNTKVLQNGLFTMENLPIMILTHACTFFFGAAVMFVYLRKYCGWSSMLTNTMG